MEMICVGFLLGSIGSIIILIIGMYFGSEELKKELLLKEEEDVQIYVPKHKKIKHTAEEKKLVLYTLGMHASSFEKDILDEIIDDVDKDIDDGK